MKEIKLAILEQGYQTFWLEILKKYYKVNITEENPDYVICGSATADECIQKFSCIRILLIGENTRPDFNYFDYAMGFDDIRFDDRYLQYPYFLLPWCGLDTALEKHMKSDEEYLNKSGFCSMVVSNGDNASPERGEFFDELARYKPIASGGRYKNNLPDGKPVEDKIAFRRDYKFSLVFENSSYKGYTTEKIVDAFAAGTIPIYWGDPDVGRYFNTEAFINCHDYKSWDDVIAKIQEIDQNDKLYLQMMREPCLAPNGVVADMMKKEYLESFLRNIFDKSLEQAGKRTNSKYGWGYFKERDARRHWEMDHSILVRVAYKLSRIYAGKNKYEKNN